MAGDWKSAVLRGKMPGGIRPGKWPGKVDRVNTGNEGRDVREWYPRRAVLKSMGVAGLAGLFPGFAGAEEHLAGADGRAAVLAYLASLARADGGYGWEDQADSHLTPTFAVIGCYQLLKQTPLNIGALAEFVRNHHPARLKKLEQEHRQFEFEQIQSLIWLGQDASDYRDQVSRWQTPTVYMKQYEQHGYPIFRFELAAIRCRELLGLPLREVPAYVEYLDLHRRPNGSFNNTPASDGSDGHVINTFAGLLALGALGRAGEKKDETIAWLRACQLPNGGFTYRPGADIGGNDDVAYTRAAVCGLRLLGAAPADRDACVRYLQSLWNSDGGFADRPSWLSNPLASYYALDALNALGALDLPRGVRGPASRPAVSLAANLKVFTIQIEAHGKGSPAEAVDLARALRIHLWGAKNAEPGWIGRAQAVADREKVPVSFSVANEEYGTWVAVPGMGTYSHTSDVIAPAGADFGPAVANQGVVSWPEFRAKRLAPLVRAGGRLIWQFGENDELTRMYLDDSLQRGGYTAISTFHFGNPDFTISEPFLQRYRGQIPYIALQDSHGNEPWWFADMTTGFRTLFLAAEPTWAGWLNALRQNWVVAVRRDAVSGQKLWMHGGSSQVVDFVREHEQDWRWWDNPEIQRPLVSIVAVRPQDEFEVARPEKGVTIRVRCAWQNTPQGLPKQPIAELVKLTIDGVEVSPKLIATKRAGGGPAYLDHYHQFHIPDPAPGKHSAMVRVRTVETKIESERTVEFSV